MPDITDRASKAGQEIRSYTIDDLEMRENSAGSITFEGVASAVGVPYLVRDQFGDAFVNHAAAKVEHALSDRPVQQSRVEMGKAEVLRDSTGDRALAGCRRSVDCDDKLQAAVLRESFAPSSVIRDSNCGKLVAIGAASSTVTGCCVFRPRQRKLMAIR